MFKTTHQKEKASIQRIISNDKRKLSTDLFVFQQNTFDVAVRKDNRSGEPKVIDWIQAVSVDVNQDFRTTRGVYAVSSHHCTAV